MVQAYCVKCSQTKEWTSSC